MVTPHHQVRLKRWSDRTAAQGWLWPPREGPINQLSQKSRQRAIKPKERDAIVAALQDNPDDIAGIALRFGRGVTTIWKLREKAEVVPRARRERIRATLPCK